jgi:heme exporter protein C
LTISFGRGLKTYAIASTVALVGAFACVFFWAPNDADQGFIQKIFYVHVPLAIVALVGFVAGGIFGIRFLRSGDRAHDLRSYVAIHMALIFGVGALLTGSIWAKASWGHWWLWDEPTLVSFLIVFLLYACYQPLRFSIEDPERQARYAAVFSIVGGVFVPLNFMAVRSATQDIHPRTLSHADGLPGAVLTTFLLSIAAMGLLYVTLCKFELTAKTTRMALSRARRRLAGEDVRTLQRSRSAAPQEV